VDNDLDVVYRHLRSAIDGKIGTDEYLRVCHVAGPFIRPGVIQAILRVTKQYFHRYSCGLIRTLRMVGSASRLLIDLIACNTSSIDEVYCICQ
jgi:hypothetical protein